MSKIRVLIADDNIYICNTLENILSREDNIEIVGIVNTDEDEIQKIEDLKPDIVITDIRRNNKDSGLDIIKDYLNKDYGPLFYVISGSTVPYLKNVAAFTFKPISDYNKIIKEINIIYEGRKKVNNNESQNNKYINQNIGFFKRLLNKLRN